ncbi:mitochondrial cardiolipin hydrolase isoform X2 [Schistocerca piceifrons]|uniref:mitochondrial cardiolipin hydrolase isoform X2 n=1 Tax=Schistocerca piceifrons TaxID=274613 RepID=UPI001F5EBCEC|nr:mitochondrial cardiolipin hydrolase isoform X2 [Schistocerca piceifrons]
MEKLSSFKPKVLGAIVISVILSELIWYSYKKYYKPRKPTRKNYPVVNEVIFFTDKGVNCRQHIYRCGSCGNEDCSDYKLRRLIKFLQSAKRTLDICIYMITIQDIADAVKTVHSRGVRVRVIAETGMADNKGSKIPYWRKVEKGMLRKNCHTSVQLFFLTSYLIARVLMLKPGPTTELKLQKYPAVQNSKVAPHLHTVLHLTIVSQSVK